MLAVVDTSSKPLLQGTRSVLPIPGPPCLRAGLHTSSVLHAESQRKRQSRLIREANLSKRVELQQLATTERPHVVLGTKPGDDSKWESSDLARVLVRSDELALSSSPHVISLPEGDVKLPQAFNYGIGEKEKDLLFKHLPFTTAEGNTLRRAENTYTVRTSSNMEELKEKALKLELEYAIDNANKFAPLIALRNANAQGIAFENRRRVIAEFSEPGKPNDTGRPEVQGVFSSCPPSPFT